MVVGGVIVRIDREEEGSSRDSLDHLLRRRWSHPILKGGGIESVSRDSGC